LSTDARVLARGDFVTVHDSASAQEACAQGRLRISEDVRLFGRSVLAAHEFEAFELRAGVVL
jgi:hypothetical protein